MTLKATVMISLLLVAALAVGGCGTYWRPITRAEPVDPRQVGFHETWLAAHDVLTWYHFEIAYADRREGVLRTRPLVSPYATEFWRLDVLDPYSRMEATVQTMRRSVEIRLLPDPNVPGGFTPEVEVRVDRSAYSGGDATNAGQLIGGLPRERQREDRVEGDAVNYTGGGRVRLGLDASVARRLRREILRRTARRLEATRRDRQDQPTDVPEAPAAESAESAQSAPAAGSAG